MDTLRLVKTLHEDYGISISTGLSWLGLKTSGSMEKRVKKAQKLEVEVNKVAELLQGKALRLSEWRLWDLILEKEGVQDRRTAYKIIKSYYSDSEWWSRKHISFKAYMRYGKKKLFENLLEVRELRKQERKKRKPGLGYKLSWDELYRICRNGKQKNGRAVVGDSSIRKRLKKLGLTKEQVAGMKYEEFRKLVVEYEIRKYLKEDWKEKLYQVWYKCSYCNTSAEVFFREFMIMRCDIAGKSFEEFLDFVFERVYELRSVSMKKRSLYKQGYRSGRNGGKYSCRSIDSPEELLKVLEKTSIYHVLTVMSKSRYVVFRTYLRRKYRANFSMFSEEELERILRDYLRKTRVRFTGSCKQPEDNRHTLPQLLLPNLSSVKGLSG